MLLNTSHQDIDFITLQISQYYNVLRKVNSMKVLGRFIDQYHTIVEVFCGLKVRWANLV
jgi:hypothetical protein